MSNTHQILLKGEDGFSTALAAILIDDFGTEALTWASQTIIMELESMYQTELSVSSVDRLMTAVHLLTSNSFYTSLPDFNDLCNVLSWEPLTPGVFVPSDAASCAWGITEAMLISPPEDENQAFNEQTIGYISEVLKDEGILNPPDVLRIAKLGKSLESKIRYDFSDDPVMFEAIFQVEASKTEEINNFIKKRLRALALQLGSLKLRNGNVEDVVSKMLNALPEANQKSSPLL